MLTGIDRPDPAGESLSFLGRQARLPVGHARLALRSGAAILAGAVMPSGDGRYRVMAAGLIEPKRGEGNEPRRAVRLAQQALALIEPLVRARPEEWLMFFPLWPELIPGRPAG